MIRRVAESVRAQRDLSETMSSIFADVETSIACDRALVWLLDEGTGTLTTAFGRYRGKAWNPDWSQPATWTPFTSALRDNAFAAFAREQHPGVWALPYTDDEPPGTFYLTGPIRDADRALGVFTLTRIPGDQPFSDADVEAFRTIAGLASIAVRTSIAVDNERELRRQTTQIGILTASLNQARTQHAVIEALLRGVARLIHVDHAYVALMRPQRDLAVDIHLSEALRTDERAVVPGITISDRAIEQELRQTRRYISGARLRELLEIPPVAKPDGMTGLAAVPIRNGTHLDGVLYLWSPTAPGDPGFADLPAAAIDTAETLCAQAAVALERTRLQQLAQQAADEQRTLAHIATQLSSAVTVEVMATTALEALAPVITARTARVSIIDSSGSSADLIGRLPAANEVDAELDQALAMLETWVRVDMTGWHGDLSVWLPDGNGNAQVACWPIASDNVAIGTMTIVRDGEEEFAQHEIDLTARACGQLALGLQRARSHAEAIIARDEAERNASLIARMLHISNEMSREHDLDGVLAVMDAGLATLVGFSVLEVYRADDDRQELELLHYRAIDDRPPPSPRMPYGSGAVGRAARLRRPAQGTRLTEAISMRVLGVPMVIEGNLVGIITLCRDDNQSYTQQELSLLGIFSAHAASELSRAELARRNRELYLSGIRALTSTVDARDPHTRGHSARVGQLARLIATQMGLPHEGIERVELAALLHDIGKIGIPDAILQKPGPLDQQERAIMMGHTDLGAGILTDAGSEALESLVPLVRHHHEWWDGRGYPGALSGDDIPIGAQIISVADAFDTMTNDRPYRERSTVPEAWRVLQSASGTQFAPAVVAATGEALARNPDLAMPATGDDDATPPETGTGSARTGGQLGDLRSLGVLVGLARITSHMTDLTSLLEGALAILAERLHVSLALVLDTPGNHEATARAYRQSPAGFTSVPCPDARILDLLIGAELPANLDAIDGLADQPIFADIFQTALNTGVVALGPQDGATAYLAFEPEDRDRYWRSDLEVIQAVAPHVAAVINVALMHEQAREDALTDGLTSALNYRAFQRALADFMSRRTPFAVMMFDVVGLKPLNDTVGHLAGDQLLRHTVDAIRGSLNADSIVARIGGDEFGVLLAGDDAIQPERIGQAIVERMERGVSAAYQHAVTLRFGWSAWPSDGDSPELLLHAADQRMYLHHPPDRSRHR
jgi:diguanylate cyclase (GGDEF)-like protein